nr:MAG TPA: hypothetical protein [Caudoviricetes sp.]
MNNGLFAKESNLTLINKLGGVIWKGKQLHQLK